MEVGDQNAVQAPSNVEKGREIAIQMQNVLAIWNAARAMVWMTTVILPLDLPQQTTAAMTLATPMVSNIKASYQYFYSKVWLSPDWKRMVKTWLAVKGWNSFPVWFLQDAQMEVEDLIAAQAQAPVG